MNSTPEQSLLRVAIIDDDDAHAALMRRCIESIAGELADDVEITCHCDPAEALAAMTGEANSVIICDYQLGESTAQDWIPDLVRGDHGPLLVATSAGSEEAAAESFRSGAADFLDKAKAFSDASYMLGAIRESLRRHHAAQTVKDLSAQLRRANRELAYKNEQLRSTTEAAHAFVDDVAHDFRTPLAVIKEFASIIHDGLSGPVNAEQIEHLEYVDRATVDLSEMIDDFLDSARLRAGLLRLDRRALEAREVYELVEPALASRAACKDVTLEIDMPESLPGVFADLYKASRAFTNIAVNAIKFSPSGSTVRIACEPLGECWVRYAVTDAGPGISDEDMRLMHERFEQTDLSECSRIKGFGLGLSISTQLASVNFGRLEVENLPEGGSVFSVVLPRSEPQNLLRACTRYFSGFGGKKPLALLRCEPEDSTDLQELFAFLSAACRTRDLVMATPEGTLLVAGIASEPEEWVKRLNNLNPMTETSSDPRPLRSRTGLVGAWDWPVSEDVVLDAAGVTKGVINAAE